MSKADRFEETRRWLQYAREDLTSAEAMIGQSDFVPRQACWPAQQAAEKAIKAILIFLQVDFPKSHDLDGLRNLVPDGGQLRENHPDLADLSQWAVEARYPGDWPNAIERDARSAADQARGVWNSACADLSRQGFDTEGM